MATRTGLCCSKLVVTNCSRVSQCLSAWISPNRRSHVLNHPPVASSICFKSTGGGSKPRSSRHTCKSLDILDWDDLVPVLASQRGSRPFPRLVVNCVHK